MSTSLRFPILVITLICMALSAQAKLLDDILIFAWWLPREAQLDPVRLEEYADAGFNMLVGDGESPMTTEDNFKILDNCKKLGLKAFIYDKRLWNIKETDPNFTTTLDSVVADYGSYPALAGFFLSDEPGAPAFPRLAAINKYLLSKDPSRGAFINLLPNYASPAQWGTSTYEEHVDKFADMVDPTFLSWDNYYHMTNYVGEMYFDNMEIVRSRALTRDISFSNSFLAMGHYGFRAPTLGDLRWQMYTTLAYGGRSYGYFAYWTRGGDPNIHNVGIIDVAGNRTPYYSMIKQLNAETKALAKTLVKLRSDAVYHIGNIPAKGKALPSDEVITSVRGGTALLGFFTGPGKTRYVMIVNKNMQQDCNLQIYFRKQVNLYEVSHKTGAYEKVGRLKTLDRPFFAGEGRLFAIDPPKSVVPK